MNYQICNSPESEKEFGKKIFAQGLAEIGGNWKTIVHEGAKLGITFSTKDVSETLQNNPTSVIKWDHKGIRCFEWYLHWGQLPVVQIIDEMRDMGYEIPTSIGLERVIDRKSKFDKLLNKTLPGGSLEANPEKLNENIQTLIYSAYELGFAYQELRSCLLQRTKTVSTPTIVQYLRQQYPEIPDFQIRSNAIFADLRKQSVFLAACTLIKMPTGRIFDLLVLHDFNRYVLSHDIIVAEQQKTIPFIMKYVPGFEFQGHIS